MLCFLHAEKCACTLHPFLLFIWPVPLKGWVNVLLSNAQQIDGKMVGKEETIASGIIKLFTISTEGTYFIKGISKETREVVFVKKMVIEYCIWELFNCLMVLLFDGYGWFYSHQTV